MSKHAFVAVVASGIVILDQLSKWYVRQTLPLHSRVPVIDSIFQIVHVSNSGGAFSLLAGINDSLRLPFFLIASTLAIAALVYFLSQVEPQQRLLQFALAAILGGAVGNFIDRVTAGRVTDFLDLYWGDYHWPAFNVADSFISIGVVLMLLQTFWVPSQVTSQASAEK